MMMRTMIGIAILGIATPLAAQTVTIDYAKEMDFSTLKKYQYVESKDTKAADDLMNDRIVAALKAKLNEGGLQEVQDNPDILVTYHLAKRENRSYDTMGFGGYGMGWGTWGGGTVNTTTVERTYTEGTLIVDAYKAGDKKLIWRGTGTVTVASKPEKRAKQIQKIFDKLGDKWKKILKNEKK